MMHEDPAENLNRFFEANKEGLEDLKARAAEYKKIRLEEAIVWPPADITVKRWQAHGLDCAIAVSKDGCRTSYNPCGYVRVPRGHSYEHRWYDAVEVDVHGGLTFCCKAVEGGRWFGFDTSHCDDFVEFTLPNGQKTGLDWGHKWTLQDAIKETESLAKQLSEAK